MRVGVIGAGAIGGWLTAACVKAGAEAVVLARGATFEALLQDGLWLNDGTTARCYPVKATKDPTELQDADILLLGLKAHDLTGAAPLIKAALGSDTVVVPAINGLPWWFFDCFGGPARGFQLEATDPGGVLSDLLPASRVVGSVVHAASFVETPGHVRLVQADKVWLGDVGAGSGAQKVADLLSAGGVPVEISGKLHWHVWNKLWGNSNMNPLSALARADVSQLLDDRYVSQLVRDMMREMTELGGLIGLTGFCDVEERMATTRKLGPIRTSMLQDVEAGRALEIDPILGALVELAGRLDHPVPAMNGVYGMARLLDRNLRS